MLPVGTRWQPSPAYFQQGHVRCLGRESWALSCPARAALVPADLGCVSSPQGAALAMLGSALRDGQALLQEIAPLGTGSSREAPPWVSWPNWPWWHKSVLATAAELVLCEHQEALQAHTQQVGAGPKQVPISYQTWHVPGGGLRGQLGSSPRGCTHIAHPREEGGPLRAEVSLLRCMVPKPPKACSSPAHGHPWVAPQLSWLRCTFPL